MQVHARRISLLLIHSQLYARCLFCSVDSKILVYTKNNINMTLVVLVKSCTRQGIDRQTSKRQIEATHTAEKRYDPYCLMHFYCYCYELRFSLLVSTLVSFSCIWTDVMYIFNACALRWKIWAISSGLTSIRPFLSMKRHF